MKVYKLRYSDKDEAVNDLKAKGVLVDSDEGLIYGEHTQAVVYLGKLVDIQGTYDEQGNELTAPTFLDGYHVDIMLNVKPTTDEEGNVIEPNYEALYNFTANEVEVTNPRHKFA